jgi:hypothetical protein
MLLYDFENQTIPTMIPTSFDSPQESPLNLSPRLKEESASHSPVRSSRCVDNITEIAAEMKEATDLFETIFLQQRARLQEGSYWTSLQVDKPDTIDSMLDHGKSLHGALESADAKWILSLPDLTPQEAEQDDDDFIEDDDSIVVTKRRMSRSKDSTSRDKGGHHEPGTNASVEH